MPGITRRFVRPSRLAATHGLTGVTSPLNHILRLRRRKGHGIHSPYLYHLITEVLFSRHPYYCFDELKGYAPMDKEAHRLGRLLFRLAQDAGVTSTLYVGCQGSPDMAYLAMASTNHTVKGLACDEAALARSLAFTAGLHTDSVSIEPTFDAAAFTQQLEKVPALELVVLQPNPDKAMLMTQVEACLEKCGHSSLLLIIQPRSKAMAACWTAAKKHPAVTTSLDTHSFGLLLFRPDLEKRHYHL